MSQSSKLQVIQGHPQGTLSPNRPTLAQDHLTLPFRQRFQHECITGSAIDPELFSAAIDWIEDTGFWQPNRALGHRVSIQWQRHPPHNFGSLAIFRQESGKLWQAKPEIPLLDRKKSEKQGNEVYRKYETPVGAGSRAFLPPIPPAIRQRIGQRYGVEVPLSGSFWAWLEEHPTIPIVPTEGGKKGLSLLSMGYVAIALYGVNGGYRTLDADGNKTAPTLIADLRPFMVRGRPVTLAFDQDTKPETRQRVDLALSRFGALLERHGCKVKTTSWNGLLGKGIDDLVAAAGADAVEAAMAGAMTLAQQRRQKNIEISQAILSQPGPLPHRVSQGDRYIDDLPSLKPGKLHWIAANMGSGKTVAMGRDWAIPFIQSGGIVVVFSPLNSLGQQTAQEWGLPHVHDYNADATSQQALQMDIRAKGGIIACLNSAPRVARLIPQNCRLLLVIDEAGQTLGDAAMAGTLKGRYPECWEATIQLMQNAVNGAGAIALAEKGLSTDTVDLVQALSGARQTYGIDHRRIGRPWPTTVYRATPASAFRSKLLDACENRPQLLVTSSQAEAERLERAAQILGINAVRIDSKTNEAGRYADFFENPDDWLRDHRPQLLILSPSAKTGLSIEGGVSHEDAYFEQVWGYFPSLDLDCWTQLLGRYRPSVPRQVWASAYIQPEPGETPHRWTQLNDLHQTETRYAKAAGLTLTSADPHDSAIKAFLAARRQRAWAAKIRAADALADALVADGHEVSVVRGGVEKDKQISELWHQIKMQLATESSEMHAGLVIDPAIHTEKWATKILLANDAGYEQRCMAAKVRLIAKFPGINWDSADLWFEAVFQPRQNTTKDAPSSGPLAPGAAQWAEGDYAQALWATDAKKAQEILSQRLRATHLLPKSGLSAQLTALLKPHAKALVTTGEVAPGCPHALAIKATMLRFAAEASRLWRLNCTQAQSEVAIANKVLRRFGLVLARTRRVTLNGSRQWVYSVTAPALWLALVAARHQALNPGTRLLEDTFNNPVPSSEDSHPFEARGGGDNSSPPPFGQPKSA